MSTTKPFRLIGPLILRSLNLLRSHLPLVVKQGVYRKPCSLYATKSLTQRVSRLAEPNLFCHVTVSVRIRDKELDVFPFFSCVTMQQLLQHPVPPSGTLVNTTSFQSMHNGTHEEVTGINETFMFSSVIECGCSVLAISNTKINYLSCHHIHINNQLFGCNFFFFFFIRCGSSLFLSCKYVTSVSQHRLLTRLTWQVRQIGLGA